MDEPVTIYPFYRDEEIYTGHEPSWDYRELLKNMVSSISDYSDVDLRINTCENTEFDADYNFRLRRFDSCMMNLMHAVVASEADIVEDELGKNIIFCGSDEQFIRNPAELFKKYDFDILIGYDGISRIMNGLVCVRCNEKTASFFKSRLACYESLPSDLKIWGGDMHSYTRALAGCSFLFSVLAMLSFPRRAIGQHSKLQSLIYMIAGRAKILDKIVSVGPLKMKFFYWGSEIAKSVDVNGGVLANQLEMASSRQFYIVDFKGERKQMLVPKK